jgi:hypothetical protein
MRSGDSGSKYLVSRAVEEPLEASVELRDDIKDIANRALVPLNLGLLAFILIILLLVPSIYDILVYLWQGFRGDGTFSTGTLMDALIASVVITVLIAITITAFLYLLQIMNFISKNLLKSSNITDLTEVKPAHKKEKGKIPGKHLKNPIFAVMDLEEESMHVLPQIVKMLRFCVFFIGMALIIMVLIIVSKLGFDYELVFSFGIIRTGIGFVVVGKLLIMLKLLVDAESNFRYIYTRHSIIDSVRFQKDIGVPKGEDQRQRLITYLMENDPYIKGSVVAEKKKFTEIKRLKGASGKEHTFDSYFTGVNILKDKSVALGMPMGKFGVFIKIFKQDITLTILKQFGNSAVDVCKSQNMFPLRIIALQLKVSDIPEDVYEYVLENPIKMKNTLTHLEIVAEDGEVYSFIPMISYGESLG